MYKVAIYVRLSKEDGDNVQSESIDNQIDLIRQYLADKEDLVEIDTYIDDGFSGLKFDNRPAFQRMLLDIEAGKITMVITKDMSRLGRESSQTTIYLEKYFPFMNIRYVSILDNMDTLTGTNVEMAPFRIVLNDMVSRDTSKKVRGAFDAKRRQGDFIGSTSPYGYIKDSLNHNRLVIDEYAASVVKKIYALYIEGYGKGAIASMLEKDKILTPSAYKKEILKEKYYNPNIRDAKTTWSFQTIHQILTNEVYIGNMVQKKYETVSYKVRKSRKVPTCKQIRVENTHETIINAETFYMVQELLQKRTRSLDINSVEANLFVGKLVCAECGHTFTKAYDSRKKKFIGYVCSQYKRHGNLYCTSHYVKADELEIILLNVIKKEAKKLLKETDINEINNLKITNVRKSNEDLQLLNFQKNLEKYKRYKRQAYENYMDHVLSKEEYKEYSADYDMQMSEIVQYIADLEKKIEDQSNKGMKYVDWLNQFKDYLNVEQLTREMVLELVEKIVIDQDYNIDIYFNFKDTI